MKTIGIVTMIGDDNYGNRLQNYAIQEYLEKIGTNSQTLKNIPTINTKNKFLFRYIKYLKEQVFTKKTMESERKKYFASFNNNINFSDKEITPFTNCKNKFDYFLVGSDQVWNPNFSRLRDIDLLTFANNEQKISFSASFGINELPEQYHEKVRKELLKFKAISVREDAGKKIVEELTGRTDVEVLVDPTMLLMAEEWDKVSKKPEQLNNLKKTKYILNYFLGELSEERKKEIKRVAEENDCEIINILDKDSSFYQTGPSEFLYLEKNAFLICTDSFHSSVFAILYNRPFIVFRREDKTVDMNSRIETLLSKFDLKDRFYNGKIDGELLKNDYTKAYEILEKERKKSENFLKKALDIKE